MVKKKNAISILLFLLLIFYTPIARLYSPYNSKDFVAFLDVGTGDSILISSGSSSLLIDGGPSTYSTNNLSKYLNNSPTAYLATHLHSDHISGLTKFSNLSKNLYLSTSIKHLKTYESQKVLNTYTIVPIEADDVITVGNFTIVVIWPNDDCDSENPNYCSTVLLVTHNTGGSILLTSDSENSAQENYVERLSKVNVIKVPHQGSGDSLYPDALSLLSPEYAVISVGVNSYGHPSQKTIDYYNSTNTKIYRTDEKGDILLFFPN